MIKIEKPTDPNFKLTAEEQTILDSLVHSHPLGKTHTLHPIKIDDRLYVVSEIGFGDFGLMIKYLGSLEKAHDSAYWKIIVKYLEKAKEYQEYKMSKDNTIKEKDININNFTVTDLKPEDIDSYYKDLDSLPYENVEDESIKYKLEHFLVYPDEMIKKVKDGSINFGIAIELATYIEDVSGLDAFNVNNNSDQQSNV